MAAPVEAPAFGCASVVLIDGYQLLGTSISHRRQVRLPRRGMPLPAIVPGCNDGGGEEEDDGRVSVTALAGIPVRFAVVPEHEDSTVYLADGSRVELANHPLHAAFYRDSSQPSFRRARSCSRAGSLSGRVTYSGGFTRLVLATPEGERMVRVDARSRITNRPAYQPVLPRQRLRVQLIKCGRHDVADRIRFIGATITGKRFDRPPEDDGFSQVLLFVPAATVLISILLIRKI